MPVLEMNNEVKYKITVILVTAEVKNIQNRIKGRHHKMLAEEDPYIRAINPSLTKMFVSDNKAGFNSAKTYFKSNKYEEEQDTFYTKDDFTFIEVENPPLNTTRKNNNNNSNFKYF
jgi:hypothetical protein